MSWTVAQGDCVGLMREMEAETFHADYVRLIEKRMQTVTPSLFSRGVPG